MDAQFWLDRWEEGKIGFHKDDHHEKLMQYFPEFDAPHGSKVLVPLCGKSKDMIWLHSMNLYVHGIELSQEAINSFFKENNIDSPDLSEDADFLHHTHENIVLSRGDIFKLGAGDQYDYIYDRASLVALPAPMRKDYAKLMTQVLRSGGQYLLITFEYNQEQMDGPPFSVDANEIHRLYEDNFTIELKESLEEVKEGPRLQELESFRQKVYILTRK